MAIAKLHVKKDDTVVVLSGKDKGKKGQVQACFPKEGKVVVSGINMVTKHKKPRGVQDPGGIIKREAPIYASKVMVVCKSCNQPTRLAHRVAEDGSKARICKKCGKPVD